MNDLEVPHFPKPPNAITNWVQHLHIVVYLYIYCNWGEPMRTHTRTSRFTFACNMVYIYIYTHSLLLAQIIQYQSKAVCYLDSCVQSTMENGKKVRMDQSCSRPGFSPTKLARKGMFIPLTHVEVHGFWPVPTFNGGGTIKINHMLPHLY